MVSFCLKMKSSLQITLLALCATIFFQSLTRSSFAADLPSSNPEEDRPVYQSPDLVPADKLPALLPNGPLYECLANNPNCAVFYAINRDPRIAQDEAMSRCFQFPPGICRPLGCHRLP